MTRRVSLLLHVFVDGFGNSPMMIGLVFFHRALLFIGLQLAGFVDLLQLIKVDLVVVHIVRVVEALTQEIKFVVVLRALDVQIVLVSGL